MVFAITLAIKPQWRGGVFIQIGQTGPESSIETMGLTIVRINNPSFKDSILDASEAAILAKVQNLDNNIINLQVTSTDKNAVKSIAMKAFEKIQLHHASVAEATLAINKNELVKTDEELAELANEIQKYTRGVKTLNTETILKDLLANKSKLTDKRNVLVAGFSPKYSFSTRTVGEAYLLEESVFPRTKLAVVMAAILSLGATMIVVIFNYLVTRNKNA
ncbi:hypothetical protein C0V70_01720 [Bacteriovorax stolpii]|uniref:Polysaccharide chain length determinant N-terminal domain-containing protein n=2 Tax=Bacteriovorax stolpii TaxID=960 RepID=A0A2K9NMX3_BACTC|nr:hypothetical protein C0V70_01720 [Bacteriovorax stolpii]